MHAHTCVLYVCKLWRADKRRQRSRHTPDAPDSLEYLPASQEAHVVDELAPVALEYLPASQEVHVDAPASLEYVPAVQATVTDVPDTTSPI
jgi:hypothetical protein